MNLKLEDNASDHELEKFNIFSNNSNFLQKTLSVLEGHIFSSQNIVLYTFAYYSGDALILSSKID